jgi:catechol 2,3-dioxygenase-like lactoylglutathione lyase family enzyme
MVSAPLIGFFAAQCRSSQHVRTGIDFNHPIANINRTEYSQAVTTGGYMAKQLNLIGMYVADIAQTMAFYQHLGFKPINQTETTGEVRLGSMRLSFVAIQTARGQGEAFEREAYASHKGAGIYLNVQVDDVDALYSQVCEAGLKPSSAPRDWPWGHREFVLRDPDRYKLVFYQRLS